MCDCVCGALWWTAILIMMRMFFFLPSTIFLSISLFCFPFWAHCLPHYFLFDLFPNAFYVWSVIQLMDKEILSRVKNLLCYWYMNMYLTRCTSDQLTNKTFMTYVKAGKKCSKNTNNKESCPEQAVFECYKQLGGLWCYDLTKSLGAKH